MSRPSFQKTPSAVEEYIAAHPESRIEDMPGIVTFLKERQLAESNLDQRDRDD